MPYINGYYLPYWILFFMIYCFLGWCIESAIVSLDTKKLTNRGFLRGPLLPIYGFGALTIIFCTMPVRDNLVLCYIVGVIACTALEYVCAVIMEGIFKTRYWDYTGHFMNFQGRICLVSSLFWGVLTLLVVHVIHEPISGVVTRIGLVPATVIAVVFLVALDVDLYISARAAFDLNKAAAKLEELEVQVELAKMELRDAVEEKARELESRINDLVKSREEQVSRVKFGARNLIRSNPTAVHKRFEKGYKELRELLKK